MSSERLSKKQRDILTTLIIVDSKLSQDHKKFKPKTKMSSEEKKEIKEFVRGGRLKVELVTGILEIKNKQNFYKNLRNLEVKKLIKIKRDKNDKFIVDIIVTDKGNALIS